MEMSLMTLEVDGGFSNPIVVQSMAIWIAILLALLVPGTVSLARRGRVRRPAACAVVLALLLMPLTQIARVMIGTWIYQRTTHPTVLSVGFWGGSAPLVVPAVVAMFCYLVYALIRRARQVASPLME
jgi:lysylphosphatidylglycerol synthetase-like protein (DUF2156 family)